jgi:hypothetical protein
MAALQQLKLCARPAPEAHQSGRQVKKRELLHSPRAITIWTSSWRQALVNGVNIPIETLRIAFAASQNL